MNVIVPNNRVYFITPLGVYEHGPSGIRKLTIDRSPHMEPTIGGPAREATLDEYIDKLPLNHLARRQYFDLIANQRGPQPVDEIPKDPRAGQPWPGTLGATSDGRIVGGAQYNPTPKVDPFADSPATGNGSSARFVEEQTRLQPVRPGETRHEYFCRRMRELDLYAADSDYNGMIARSVEALSAVMASQGHSGMSAEYTIAVFKMLADAWSGPKPATGLLHPTGNDLMAAILLELDTAREKFPTWPRCGIDAAAIVGEEAGELTRACLQATYEGGTIEKCRKEAVQTAAMAIQFLLNLPDTIFVAGPQLPKRM